MILPLALAPFIASYAATNINVAISAIATDLGATAAGRRADSHHIVHPQNGRADDPGSKLADTWGAVGGPVCMKGETRAP
jgi:hypothetical protein